MSARFLPKGYSRTAEPPSPSAKNLGRLVGALFGQSKRSLIADHLLTVDDQKLYETHSNYFKEVAEYSEQSPEAANTTRFKC